MSSHVMPKRVYYRVFGALMVFTAVTVLAAKFDLGAFNAVVALAIAAAKAILVILFFMHVRYSSRLTWVFAGAGFVFLAVLLLFTLSDMLTRDWQPQSPGWEIGDTHRIAP